MMMTPRLPAGGPASSLHISSSRMQRRLEVIRAKIRFDHSELRLFRRARGWQWSWLAAMKRPVLQRLGKPSRRRGDGRHRETLADVLGVVLVTVVRAALHERLVSASPASSCASSRCRPPCCRSRPHIKASAASAPMPRLLPRPVPPSPAVVAMEQGVPRPSPVATPPVVQLPQSPVAPFPTFPG